MLGWGSFLVNLWSRERFHEGLFLELTKLLVKRSFCLFLERNQQLTAGTRHTTKPTFLRINPIHPRTTLHPPFRRHSPCQLPTRLSFLLIMLLLVQTTYSLKIRRLTEFFHRKEVVPPFSELNLLVVNYVDVLDRCVALLETAGDRAAC